MLKLLKIEGYLPSFKSITALRVVDAGGQEFILRRGLSDTWKLRFIKYPYKYIGQRAVVRTLPPTGHDLRHPVFTDVVDVSKLDTIRPEAEFLQTDGGLIEKPMEAMLGDNLLRLEIADTPEKTSVGYMFRKTIPAGEGMLFTKLEPGNFVFWMRNTLAPLDLIFVDEFLRVSEIIKGMEPMSEKLHVNKKPAFFAIEVPAGSVSINEGDPFLF